MTTELQAGSAPGRPPTARRVLANSTAQLATFAFRAVAGVGVVVLLARNGGPLALGIVQFALTVSSLLPYYYGVPTLLAREVARRPEEGRRWIEAGTLLALLLGALFTVALPAGGLGGRRPAGDGPGAGGRVARDDLRRSGPCPVRGVLGLGATGPRDGRHRRPGGGVLRWDGRRAGAGRRAGGRDRGLHGLPGPGCLRWLGARRPPPRRSAGAPGGARNPVADGAPVHPLCRQRHVDVDLRALRRGAARSVEGPGGGRSLPGGDEPRPVLQRDPAEHQPGALPAHGAGVAGPAGGVRPAPRHCRCGSWPSSACR